jgi:hypothetical protein
MVEVEAAARVSTLTSYVVWEAEADLQGFQ